MTDDAFLRTIQEKPNDDTTRLIYADWLEERDDEVSMTRARFLRADCELALLPRSDKRRGALDKRRRKLARRLDASWLAVVGKLEIERCSFVYKCPLKWENLQPVEGETGTRYCDKCHQNVYYSETIDEARRHGMLGECVAVDPRLVRLKGDLAVHDFTMRMGRMLPAPSRRPEDGQDD